MRSLKGEPGFIVIWKGRVEPWPYLQLGCINNPHASQTSSPERTCHGVWRLRSDTLPRRSAHNFDDIKSIISLSLTLDTPPSFIHFKFLTQYSSNWLHISCIGKHVRNTFRAFFEWKSKLLKKCKNRYLSRPQSCQLAVALTPLVTHRKATRSFKLVQTRPCWGSDIVWLTEQCHGGVRCKA